MWEVLRHWENNKFHGSVSFLSTHHSFVEDNICDHTLITRKLKWGCACCTLLCKVRHTVPSHKGSHTERGTPSYEGAVTLHSLKGCTNNFAHWKGSFYFELLKKKKNCQFLELVIYIELWKTEQWTKTQYRIFCMK